MASLCGLLTFLFSDGIDVNVTGSIQISSFRNSSVDIYTQNRHVSSLLVQFSCITRHKSCITRTRIATCRLISPLTRIILVLKSPSVERMSYIDRRDVV